MALRVYDRGDVAALNAVFRAGDGALTDPGSVRLVVTKPSGVTTYATGFIHDSTGHYRLNLALDELGDWYYRWACSADAQGAESGQFMVRGSGF